jgi:hypothetical protein
MILDDLRSEAAARINTMDVLIRALDHLTHDSVQNINDIVGRGWSLDAEFAGCDYSLKLYRYIKLKKEQHQLHKEDRIRGYLHTYVYNVRGVNIYDRLEDLVWAVPRARTEKNLAIG